MLFGFVRSVVAGNDAMWTSYVAWDQEPGMGDGSDGLFDNRMNCEDLGRIVSVVAGAIATWNGLISSPAVTPRRPLERPSRRYGASRRR